MKHMEFEICANKKVTYIVGVQTNLEADLKFLLDTIVPIEDWTEDVDLSLRKLRRLFETVEATFNPSETSLLTLAARLVSTWFMKEGKKTKDFWHFRSFVPFTSPGAVQAFDGKWQMLVESQCRTSRTFHALMKMQYIV